MGKIITGEEFVDLVMDCYEGITNGEPNRSDVADAIGQYFGVTCEDSNKCSAYGSTTPHGKTIYLYDFWEWIYGYGPSTYGDDFYFQLVDSSQYANKKLIDSTNLPVIRDHMRCTNIPFVNDIPFTSYATENNSSAPSNCDVTFEIKIGDSWHNWCQGSGNPDGSVLSITYWDDFVIGGSENFLDDDTEYDFRVTFGFESASNIEDYSYIDNLGVSLASSYGETYIDTIFDETPDSGSGFSFKVSGSTSLIFMKELDAIEIYGDWVGDTGSDSGDYYSNIYITNSFIRTSASYNYMYITGATTGSTITSSSVYLVPPANLQQNTAISIYVDGYDLDNGEITLRTPSSFIGSSGSFLLPLLFSYGTVQYKLYIPITLKASGEIVVSSSEVYIELNGWKGLYAWNNTTSTSITYRPLSSSGLPSIELSAGSNAPASPSYNLINKLHIYSSNQAVDVNVAASMTDGGSMSYTVATSISNSVISIIPPNYSFDHFLTHIMGGSGYYNVYFG